MIEEAHTLTQQDMGHAHIDFVEQARLQSLLDRAGPVQGNIFLACKLPGPLLSPKCAGIMP